MLQCWLPWRHSASGTAPQCSGRTTCSTRQEPRLRLEDDNACFQSNVALLGVCKLKVVHDLHWVAECVAQAGHDDHVGRTQPVPRQQQALASVLRRFVLRVRILVQAALDACQLSRERLQRVLLATVVAPGGSTLSSALQQSSTFPPCGEFASSLENTSVLLPC